MKRRRQYCFEEEATGLATRSQPYGMASGSELRRVRSIVRCTALTSANRPASDRSAESGTGIGTMSPDGRIFLPPPSQVLRSPMTGRVPPCEIENAPRRRAEGWCDETNGVQRASASRTPSAAGRLRNASVQQDGFPPNDWRSPASIQQVPYRRDRG